MRNLPSFYTVFKGGRYSVNNGIAEQTTRISVDPEGGSFLCDGDGGFKAVPSPAKDRMSKASGSRIKQIK